jgi:two-component system LytT family sensor kinase
VGLSNVDERMRTVYGNDYGIVVETAPDLGTRVMLRVPDSPPGLEQSGPGRRGVYTHR